MKLMITGIALIIFTLQINALPSDQQALHELKKSFDTFMQQQTDGGASSNEDKTEIEHAALSKQETDQEEDGLVSTETLRYRLVNGGNRCRGRVEVYFGGSWGSVCDDGFGLDEAAVVCRSVGYRRAIAVKARAFYGQAPSNCPIWLDDVDCRGDESEIAQCAHLRFGSHNCRHSEDVGVICGY